MHIGALLRAGHHTLAVRRLIRALWSLTTRAAIAISNTSTSPYAPSYAATDSNAPLYLTRYNATESFYAQRAFWHDAPSSHRGG